MKKSTINYFLFVFAVLVMGASIWGPEFITRYKDRTVLDRIHTQTSEQEGAGYRYKLDRNEKLYILSQCLNSQSLPESELNALTRVEGEAAEYQEVSGTYAFVADRRGTTGKEITDEEIYTICNEMLQELKDLGILSRTVRSVNGGDYDAVLYSAIDVLEPRNNVAVWKVSLSTNKMNADKANRLIDAYLDADDGKPYEFYARTDQKWEDINPDEIIEKWRTYMGLGAPTPYETDNPLLETTPYYKKYVFAGMGEERTIVTIGFYEGINELFLKISR
ncbi:MAG: hypothetical protein K2O16_04640 [Lachnospiraceae bacterium]|nr:hypothetical protein [Lachnospiraceae bacterium]